MKHCIASLCAAVLFAPALWGQMAADDVADTEFPGLQFLPPGSKVKGISLPRYENHRVSALYISKLVEIVNRSDVRFTGIRAHLYAENGETTVVTNALANYSFRSKLVTSDKATSVDSPRFTAHGTGVVYHSANSIGILKGPVHTTVQNAAFNRKSQAK